MPSTDSPAVFSGLPQAEYFNRKGWNASLLKVAISKTPAHAYNAFLAADRTPSKESAALRIGSLLHQALLEPEVWQQIKAVSFGPTTKAFAQAVKDAEANGQVVAQEDEYNLAKAMASSVLDHPALGALFAHTPENLALNELTLTWPDLTSGQPCKARLDAVRITDEEILILDLKTTADATAQEFGKSAANFHYILQGSFYADSVFFCADALEKQLKLPKGHLLTKPVVFEFIAIEKTVPHLVARYRLTTEQAELGRRLYRRGLDLVTRAAELEWWEGFSTGPAPLELPAYSWTQMEKLASQ